MALIPKLELKQGQALVMTPQLQQAIKLLQLSNMELAAYVEQELEKNPLLEREEADPDGTPPSNSDESDPSSEAAEQSLQTDASEARTTDSAMSEPGSQSEPGDDFDQFDNEPAVDPKANEPGLVDWTNVGSGKTIDLDGLDYDATLSRERTLHDHLSDQLAIAAKRETERLIGGYLIDLIDDSGYLGGDLLSAAERLGADVSEVLDCLKMIQSFEPAGVGARDLKECLTIQLTERNRFDPAMQTLIENIELLAKHDLAGLKRICQVDQEDLAEMIAEIRELNPKPGLAFGFQPVQPVVPDIYVTAAPDGGWKVELNSETLPRVLVNSQYYAEVSRTANRDDDKAYLSECMANANWLVKSLDQRARTILKVATEIVRQQDGFFAYGVRRLRPLNLRVIAEAISMHESTVSRVTANKYMSTPRGVYELKYFFTAAIGSSAGGEAHSAEFVRHQIRELIDKEAPDAILSDDRIVEILNEEGIEIARRTVAKYREALRIPSSVQRRRLKRRSA